MAPIGPRSGEAIFASVERVNAELFTLTYGAIVRQLLTDLEEVEEVNKQLDQMGYNIGIRLIDEFLAKSNVSRCVDFKETAEVIAKVFYCHLNSLTFGSNTLALILDNAFGFLLNIVKVIFVVNLRMGYLPKVFWANIL
ncbi:hypothetical protein QN277_018420 [Acacia crassicarpa]|uniref:Trafficking protein particle complex subunit n=1 Tax=Acacia crassicarpa TaxID=499986 RepID=A0AAE1JRI3_9FABA|nr:hypothetical protein QN277_018420 [Acacia crassicarpa]